MVLLYLPCGDVYNKVMIHTSIEQSTSPLIVEATALNFAAIVAKQLNIQGATFFTDNLTLAKAFVVRNIISPDVIWEIMH